MATTTSTQRFRSRCGENISLSDNNTVAERLESFCDGIVFTEQPVALGTVFQVKILECDSRFAGSISIGMTTQYPDNISIPSYALHWRTHSDYWILAGSTVYHNDERSELEVNLSSLRVGQNVGCTVSREGELHVYINGVDKGIVWTGLPTHKPFWGVADVFGHTKKTQFDINPHATAESVPLYRQLLNKLSITKPQEPTPTIRHREDQVSNPQATPPHQTSSGTAKDTNSVPRQQITHLQQDNHPEVTMLRQDHQQEITHLQQVNNSLKQESIRYQQSITQLEQDHQQEITRLQQVNNSLKQDSIRYQQSITQLEQEHQQEITHLQEKNNSLKQESIHHQQSVAQLQQDNARLKQIHQQEITRLQDYHQQEIAHLQEEAGQLQSGLDQQPKLGSDTDISFWVVSHDEIRRTGQVLGEGGWGRVVVGSFRGQDVAMKQLHSILSSCDYYKDLLRREISLMAKVRHPNLLLFMAAVLDSPSNTPIIITELMDTNLRQAYHNAQLTNNGVKLSILRDVSAALNYLHLQSNPIIHRDVSSANVLLLALPNNKWRGKLSDFGSANLVQHASTPGPGAAMYTAPEVFKGEQQTTKMDVFSFGKLLCEVLSNRLPDPGAFPSMLQSMAKDWPLMHQLISSCVQQNPNKRPAMSYIVDQLNHFTKR